MPRTKYICFFLLLLILSSCTPVDQGPTLPTVNPIDLLISSEDMPVDWKSSEVFSDEYDDQCYIDCAIIIFSPAEKNGVYSEQSVYVYNTIEEAGRNYERLLLPGTAPSDWSFYSSAAKQFNISCNTHRDKAFPSCIWTAQYGNYVVEFYAALLPNRMSLSDFEKVLNRIDLKMRVVANGGQ